MGIPGSPFPDLPPPDKSNPLPIQKVGESSSTQLNLSTSDEIFSAAIKKSEKESDWTRIFLPKEGRLSLIDFVRIINRSIRLFEEGQQASELMDRLMNKKLNHALSQGASSLRRYKGRLESLIAKWLSLESDIALSQEKLNGQIKSYQETLLSQGASDEDIKNASQKLNHAIEEFNLYISKMNAEIKQLNEELQFLGIEEIEKLKTLALVSKEKKQKLPLLKKRVIPNVEEILGIYYEPVQSATIGYMSSLSQVLDLNRGQPFFDHEMMKALGGVFLDLLLVKFSAISYDLIGKSGSNSASLAKAISWTTLGRLLAGSAIRTSMVEARIPLTEGEIQEIQLLTLNIMSKAAMQAATGPAFQSLGNDLGKVSLNDSHIAVFQALGLMSRIESMIQKGVVKEAVFSLISSNPRLTSFPQADKNLLSKKLTAIVSLALLQNVVVHAAIALKAPGLVGQVLNLSFQEAGLEAKIAGGTFNDLLSNRLYIASVSSALVSELTNRGLKEEDALEIVKQAINHTLGYGVFTNFGEFTNILALKFYSAGIPDISLSRALAIKASELLGALSPKLLKQERKLLSGFTIGAVPKEALQSQEAIKKILIGYDKEIFEPMYQRAVDNTLKAATLDSLIDSFSKHPLLAAEGQKAPQTTRDVLVEFFREFVRQGASVEDALGIAENTLKFLVSSDQTQKGFLANPHTVHAIYDHFDHLFETLGIGTSLSKSLSKEATKISLNYFDEASKIAVLDKLYEGIDFSKKVGPTALFSESLLENSFVQAGISPQFSADLSTLIAPYFDQMSVSSYGLKDHLEEVIVHELFYSKQQAEKVLHFVNEENTFHLQPLEETIAKELVRLGKVSDLTEAMTKASVVTKNAMHVQGAFASVVDLQYSLLTNLSVGWGIDKNLGEKLLPLSLIESTINKDALKKELLNAFYQAEDSHPEAHTAIVLSQTVSEQRSINSSLKEGIRHALVGTLNIDPASADSVANQVNLSAVFNENGFKEALETVTKETLKVENDDVITKVMNTPHVLESQESFKKAFQDALFIVGVSPETAQFASDSLKVQGFYHIEKLKTELVNALEGAGFSQEEAKKLSFGAALNIFNMNSSEIDLQVTPQILEQKAALETFAKDELSYLMANAPSFLSFMKQNKLEQEAVSEAVENIVSNALEKKNAALNETTFRAIIADQLALQFPSMTGERAALISDEIEVSDLVKKELFLQEIARQAKEALSVNENEIDQLKMIAVEIYRDATLFLDQSSFDQRLTEMIIHQNILKEKEAKQLVDALHIGILFERQNPLFSLSARELLPQIELREELMQLILEHFKGAINNKRLKITIF